MIEAFQVGMGIIGILFIFGYSILRTIEIDNDNDIWTKDKTTISVLVAVQVVLAVSSVIGFIILGING